MAILIYKGEKHNLNNFNNMKKRCSCKEDYYTYVENPIHVILRRDMRPTLFKSNGNAYNDEEYFDRAISFKGCVCELEKISKNYRIYGGRRPSQYNWGCIKIDKLGNNKNILTSLPYEVYGIWKK